MADRIHDRSSHPPKSIPPITDEVDRGWPRVEPEGLREMARARERKITDALADTPVAPSSVVAPSSAEAPSPVVENAAPVVPVARPSELPKADVTALPSAFEHVLTTQRSRSWAWLLAPAALLGAWFVLRPSAPQTQLSVEPARTASEAAMAVIAKPTEAAAPAAPQPLPVNTSFVDPPAVVSAGVSTQATSAAPVGSNYRPTQVSVKITVSPPETRIFRHGKPVGWSGVVVTLDPWERYRFYELVLAGYVTRKLVVDGSKPEMRVRMWPESKTTH